MNIEIKSASLDQKSVTANLIELYKHDLSEFEQTDVNEHGKYGYKYLDHYWVEENRHPFIICVDKKIAGFVLVNDITVTGKSDLYIAEFFILKKYRRRGIGQKVAHSILSQFDVKWELSVSKDNSGGKVFWKKIVEGYTNRNYEVTENKNRPLTKVI
ncbi:MAG: GNAT family N-acetyltransferase [Anaerolineae bacterium]|jgi:predicted acetyltransferase|nr:GNAT family N-acetyltransferase [Anaerolineae bacterium]MBT7190924.1 GNAT family N-acetyltransferase [Anaerolineae bacterium]MBT7990737.1 GNAT family N-acetyltransferase [Anaerolineae bacterium]